MRRPSSRRTLYGDIAGMLLVLGGIIAYLWSGGAFRLLERTAGAPGSSSYGAGGALAEFDRIQTLSRVGLALVLAGMLVLIVTAIVQWREQQRSNAA